MDVGGTASTCTQAGHHTEAEQIAEVELCNAQKDVDGYAVMNFDDIFAL